MRPSIGGLAALLAVGCAPTPTPAPALTPALTPTPTPTLTPTPTPTPTPTSASTSATTVATGVGQAVAPPTARGFGPAECAAIAADIEALKASHAELADFDAKKAVTKADCTIGYTFRCHKPTGRGGWTAAVPNPDPDGIWFHIGIWDPSDPSEAMSQINTQPVIPRWTLGGRRVTWLVLEGSATSGAARAVFRVLEKHGLK